MNPDIKHNLAYLFAYKFRNLFFVLFIVLLYFAFTESLTYLVYAVISLGLGVYAHILRNKIVKK